MKKFALLGAVAALATAGGVFAAFVFTEEGISGNNQAQTVTVTVEEDQTNSNGTFAVKDGSKFDFEIKSDGAQDVNNVSANFGEDDSVIVTYVSNTTVSHTVNISFEWVEDSITAGGVTVTYAPITATSMDYDDGQLDITEFIKNSITVTGQCTSTAAYSQLTAANFGNSLTITATIA